MEIHQAGTHLFQHVQNRVKETGIKALAISVGIACFPEGLEEPESLVRTFPTLATFIYNDDPSIEPTQGALTGLP